MKPTHFRISSGMTMQSSSLWRYHRQVALAKGVPFQLEQRALGKDGQYRWFFIRYNPAGRASRHYISGRGWSNGYACEGRPDVSDLRDRNHPVNASCTQSGCWSKTWRMNSM